MKRQKDYLEKQVAQFNNSTAGGKWKHMMPGLVTGKNLAHWGSQVRWPWGEKPGTPPSKQVQPTSVWRDAATAERKSTSAAAQWVSVAGLGPSARAMALEPASLKSSWKENDPNAPALQFPFESNGSSGEALIDFLPTFRIYPGIQLRVAVSIDNQPAALVEVPGSNGREDENGQVRANAVQDNYVRAHVPVPALSAGRHVLQIRAVDPGVVIDRISLPAKN